MIQLTCYLDEELEVDCHAVGCSGDNDLADYVREWCEDEIGTEGEDWGFDWDEFYSPLTAGMMFWFKTSGDRLLFRLRWCPVR